MLCATETVYEIHHNNIPNLVDTLSIYNNSDSKNCTWLSHCGCFFLFRSGQSPRAVLRGNRVIPLPPARGIPYVAAGNYLNAND